MSSPSKKSQSAINLKRAISHETSTPSLLATTKPPLNHAAISGLGRHHDDRLSDRANRWMLSPWIRNHWIRILNPEPPGNRWMIPGRSIDSNCPNP